MEYELHCGDCLEIMPTLGKVDAVITDPPYGTTACAWDSVIPFEPMWAGIKHVIKPRGAVVLFGSQPFTSALVMSNPTWFKYAWVWDKVLPVGHLVAKHRPMQQSEDVCVFGSSSVQYNPIMSKRNISRFIKKGINQGNTIHLKHIQKKEYQNVLDARYPTTILSFPNTERNGFHPTQKPVALLEYLIRTYTNEGDTVLDFTMGSGSTGVAAMLTGRRFIGIELDPGYFAIAKQRIEDAARQARGEFKRVTDTQTHDDLPLFAGA